MVKSETQKLYNRWLWKAPTGLIIIGFGISLIGESITAKANATSFSDWFFLGTFSLVVFNAGLCIFADSVKDRAVYEIKQNQDQSP